jgi:CRP/FNR family transcriptional regulator, anaerobic regulatory protein
VIQEVAFGRVDLRLAQNLLELADGAGRVHRTHQSLATEVGTAREVISRQLHEFQRRGWVVATRGEVRLADRPALEAFVNAT